MERYQRTVQKINGEERREEMKKKILINIIAILLVFALIGCENTDNPIITPPDGGGTEVGDFKVTLILEGEKYIPDPEDNISARWTGQNTFKDAPFDENGIASTSGLDGDYYVTLTNLPDGLSYNPNINIATNKNKEVEIELFPIKTTSKNKHGTDLYEDIITITSMGVYRATLEQAGQFIYYQFEPKKEGYYVIESWADTVSNSINPILYIYKGSYAYKNEDSPTIVTGGTDGFTSNFSYAIRVDAETIGSNGAGGAVYAFGIKVDMVDANYPVTLDFRLRYTGANETPPEDTPGTDLIVPKELGKINPEEHEYGSEYTFTGAEVLTNGVKLFDGDNYKLNPETGFYHRYNSETGEYGEILYAKITTASRWVGALINVEDAGNKALTIFNEVDADGDGLQDLDERGEKVYLTENYKLFIEGTYPLTLDPGELSPPSNGNPGVYDPQASSGPYLCNRYCPCRLKNSACLECGAEYVGVCLLSCKNCLDSCRRVPDGGTNNVGYAGVVNSDGAVPVTKELQEFLQKFAVQSRYFMDGDGWVEISSDVEAVDGGQWLFCCGYYIGN